MYIAGRCENEVFLEIALYYVFGGCVNERKSRLIYIMPDCRCEMKRNWHFRTQRIWKKILFVEYLFNQAENIEWSSPGIRAIPQSHVYYQEASYNDAPHREMSLIIQFEADTEGAKMRFSLKSHPPIPVAFPISANRRNQSAKTRFSLKSHPPGTRPSHDHRWSGAAAPSGGRPVFRYDTAGTRNEAAPRIIIVRGAASFSKGMVVIFGYSK